MPQKRQVKRGAISQESTPAAISCASLTPRLQRRPQKSPVAITAVVAQGAWDGAYGIGQNT